MPRNFKNPILDFVRKHSKQRGGAFAVLQILAEHADFDTGYCYPKVETLADECHLSVRQVQYHLRHLAEAGEILTCEGRGRGNCSSYIVVTSQQILPIEIPPAPKMERAEKVQSIAPFKGKEKVQFGSLKGAISSTEKVQFPVSPSINEQSIEQLEREHVATVKATSVPSQKTSLSVSSNDSPGRGEGYSARNNPMPNRPLSVKPKPEPLAENWQPSEADVAWLSDNRPDLTKEQARSFTAGFLARYAGKVIEEPSRLWRNQARQERVSAFPVQVSPSSQHPSRFIVRHSENDNRNPNALRKQSVVSGGLPA